MEENCSSNRIEAVIIGAGIVDIPVQLNGEDVFRTGSHPVDQILMNLGGDAANEAVVLSRLRHHVKLISKVGNDTAGNFVISTCGKEGVDTSAVRQAEGLDTGINLVLIDRDGERSFITNRNGSLRKLTIEDIRLSELEDATLLCFASIFVFPLIREPQLKKIFQEAKTRNMIVCADMTKCKNGEKIEDLKEALCYLDYIFPNLEEAKMVTGKEDIDEIADAFLQCGVKNVVIKMGKQGCFMKNNSRRIKVPVYPETRCLDTTGAGDSFVAGFLSGILEEKDLLECGVRANAVASITVEYTGAVNGLHSGEEVEAREQKIRENL